MNYNISFGKMLELDLVIESKDMCCLLPGVLHWCFGTISVVWSLAQGGSKLGIAADWPRGRSCAPSRAGVGRQCTDKGMWVFLYAQILPTHLAFVTNVCLKAVSDVSVPFLFFVFRFNPHFPFLQLYWVLHFPFIISGGLSQVFSQASKGLIHLVPVIPEHQQLPE